MRRPTVASSLAAGKLLQAQAVPECLRLPFLYQTRTLQRFFSNQRPHLNLSENSDATAAQPEKEATQEQEHKSTQGSDDARFQLLKQSFEGPSYHEPRRLLKDKAKYIDDVKAGLIPAKTMDATTMAEQEQKALRRQKRLEAWKERAQQEQQAARENEHIPFEGVDGARPAESTNKTTMTVQERKAFARLKRLQARKQADQEYRERKAQEVLKEKQQAEQKRREEEALQAALAPRKFSSQNAALAKLETDATLDDILDAALSSVQAETGLRRAVESEAPRRPSAPPTGFLVWDLRKEEMRRIGDELKNALTDVELWEIFSREVLAPVSALDLDANDMLTRGEMEKRLGKRTSAAALGEQLHARDKAIIMPNFPALTLFAARTLVHNFPSSSLVLSILPTLRKMGPSVYVLGASTRLYNTIMAYLQFRYMDYDGIADLLEEMEREVIEPDMSTLAILDHILATWSKVRRGMHGETLTLLFETRVYLDAVYKIREWREKVEMMVQLREMRTARRAARAKVGRSRVETAAAAV